MSHAGPARFVDLARYPILDLDAPAARELVAHCRSQLAASGACELPGFVTPAATERMVAESDTLVGKGHFAETRATVYLGLPEPGLADGHPRGRLGGRSAVEAIAYDLVPPSHALRQLFEWDGLMEFVAAALAKPKLYRYADPLGALNVAVMRAGDELQWHFDQTDFVVSIALRDALHGGDFEYTPLIRSRDDERYDDVRRVLDGDHELVRAIPMTPGTLLLFEGRNSMHRVTPIEGGVARLVALLAYDTKPDTVSTELLRRARYGRNHASAAHGEA
jgi:hypothetical protein